MDEIYRDAFYIIFAEFEGHKFDFDKKRFEDINKQ